MAELVLNCNILMEFVVEGNKMLNVNISYRQYFISSIRYDIPNMLEIKWQGIYVYLGNGLDYDTVKDARDRKYLILGDVFTSSFPKTVEEEISIYDGDDINDLVNRWTGRWIIIGQDEIQIDACGLMQAFYYSSDTWFISSSLSLIKELSDMKFDYEVCDDGLNWRLLPYTLIRDVKSLICTQKIKFSKDCINVLFNPWIQCYDHLSTEAKVNILTNELTNTFKSIYRYSRREIWIALTGGKDSRLVLASAKNAEVPFSTYNSYHSSISSADIRVPIQLARKYGFTHHRFKPGAWSSEKESEYLYFNGGNSKGADWRFFSNGQHDLIPSDAVVIRGGIFEAGQNFARTILTDRIDDMYDQYTNYYNAYFDERQSESLKLWLDYIRQHPIPFIDFRDRLYIEQRVGGWVASIEQALTINKWHAIQIANNRLIVSVLLSANSLERKELALSFDAIRSIDKTLMEFTVNKQTVFDKIKYYSRFLLSPSAIYKFIKRRVKK